MEFGWLTAYSLLCWYIQMFDIFINYTRNTVLLLCNTIMSIKHSLDQSGCILQLIPNIAPSRTPSYNGKLRKLSTKSRADVISFITKGECRDVMMGICLTYLSLGECKCKEAHRSNSTKIKFCVCAFMHFLQIEDAISGLDQDVFSIVLSTGKKL